MNLKRTLDKVYETWDGSGIAMEYSERHNVRSAAVLTVYDDETAGLIAEHLAPRISGKTVVEIGGGIGLLSLHLSQYAKRVFCIDANPAWSWAFVGCLYANKPKNVSYLFGAADEFVGLIKGDVALFCTHSDMMGMRLVGQQFAPAVIDVYGEIIASAPGRFDKTATALRELDLMAANSPFQLKG